MKEERTQLLQNQLAWLPLLMLTDKNPPWFIFLVHSSRKRSGSNANWMRKTNLSWKLRKPQATPQHNSESPVLLKSTHHTGLLHISWFPRSNSQKGTFPSYRHFLAHPWLWMRLRQMGEKGNYPSLAHFILGCSWSRVLALYRGMA